MRTAYIAIVGTRDIRIENETLLERLNAGKSPACNTIREYSKEIRDNYGTYRDRITAPILVPGLQRVLAAVGDHERIDELLLFATDQGTSSDYAKNDTLYIGEILERRLPELFGPRIAHISLCPIPGNPADYDQMYTFFADQLPHRIKPGDFDAVWLAPVGGPPASTTGMLLNAVRTYHRASQLIFVNENAKTQTLDLHGVILRNFAREEARAHLQRRDFRALRETMQRAGLGEPWLWHLCTYAERRLHFDFDGADEALGKALHLAPGADARTKLTRCRHSLALLRKTVAPADSTSSPADWKDWLEVQAANIAELYFNLELKVQREEWVDFLGRLFRLHEAALRIMFERKMSHSAEQVGWEYPDFEKALTSDAALSAYFKSVKTPLKKADTKALRVWLDCQCGVDATTYKDQLDRCLLIEKLKTIRNKSIMAHGYKGVSRTNLENNLTPLSLEGFVRGPMRDYLADPTIGAHVDPSDNPFSPVVSWLEKVLDT